MFRRGSSRGDVRKGMSLDNDSAILAVKTEKKRNFRRILVRQFTI